MRVAALLLAITFAACLEPAAAPAPASSAPCRDGESRFFLRRYDGPGYSDDVAMPRTTAVDRNGTVWAIDGDHRGDGKGYAAKGTGAIHVVDPPNVTLTLVEIRWLVGIVFAGWGDYDYNITYGKRVATTPAQFADLCRLTIETQPTSPSTAAPYIVDAGRSTFWFDTASGKRIVGGEDSQDWPARDRLVDALHALL